MFPPSGLDLTLENDTPYLTTSAIVAATTAMTSSMSFPTVSQTLTAAASTATAAASSPMDEDPDNGECRLLGPFALFVQGALGGLALLALVYKRWKERPQRPLKIWSFDVSKQVVGSVLVHGANLLMSMLSSGQFSIRVDPATVSQRRATTERYTPNPCSFYLLNLAIDTTIGIPILIFLLRMLTAFFALTPVGIPRESIESGNYGNPPRAGWWFKQCIIYFIGLMGMKTCVLIIFVALPWISRVGDWALRWTEGDEALQVIFVMLVFPVIMNATQYYIIDSFIKNQRPTDHERLLDENGSVEYIEARNSDDYGESSGSSDEINSGDEDDESIDEEELKARADMTSQNSGGSVVGSTKEAPKPGNKEYDPRYDGDSSPTVVGSTSTH